VDKGDKKLRKQKNVSKFVKLNLDLFPNGPHYFKYNDSLDPYIIHFNYLVGNNEKINKMKETNQWYV